MIAVIDCKAKTPETGTEAAPARKAASDGSRRKFAQAVDRQLAFERERAANERPPADERPPAESELDPRPPPADVPARPEPPAPRPPEDEAACDVAATDAAEPAQTRDTDTGSGSNPAQSAITARHVAAAAEVPAIDVPGDATCTLTADAPVDDTAVVQDAAQPREGDRPGQTGPRESVRSTPPPAQVSSPLTPGDAEGDIPPPTGEGVLDPEPEPAAPEAPKDAAGGRAAASASGDAAALSTADASAAQAAEDIARAALGASPTPSGEAAHAGAGQTPGGDNSAHAVKGGNDGAHVPLAPGDTLSNAPGQETPGSAAGAAGISGAPVIPEPALAQESDADDSERQDDTPPAGRHAAGEDAARGVEHGDFLRSLERATEPQSAARAADNAARAAAQDAAAGSMLERTERIQDLLYRLDEHVLSLVTGRDSRSMTVSLVPPNLGKVVLNCREKDGVLHVEIVVGTEGVRGVLAEQESALRDVLQTAGFKLAQFDVRTQNEESPPRQRAGNPGRGAARREPAVGAEPAEAVGSDRAEYWWPRGQNVWIIA